MIKFIAPLFAGLVFGIGLWVSGMTDPEKVAGFLNMLSWSPDLAFVMGGALAVHIPAQYWIRKKRTTSLCGAELSKPLSQIIDKKLIIGAVLFGAGWGMAGLCPGPAIASIVTLNSKVLVFVFAMLFAMFVFNRIDTKKEKEDA